MEALKQASKVPKKSLATKVVIALLLLILIMINFVFNTISYLKRKGCIVGTSSSLNYVNSLAGKLDNTLIYYCLQAFSTLLSIHRGYISPMEKNRKRTFKLYRKTEYLSLTDNI